MSRDDHCRRCHHPPGAAERTQGVVVTGVTKHSINYSLVVNQSTVSVQSGGSITLRGGDDNRFNTAGSDVTIAAGDGVHQNRGRGGTVAISGGDGLGIQNFDKSVTGGAVKLTGGMSKVGTGGNIDVAGGVGATTGGSINLASGTSSASTSGSVTIKTAGVITKAIPGESL
ncbi:Ankyrin repeat domain-containing protein 1 [Phytophthora nicotianae]|uniref:Ankyrin repeat domain-containing protein 1 n=1 Tax=Phytophthora nicotianae TaxID=4792 RepID=A0A0W8CZ80_PHYNI|nr:Ankyrin repeat domain-containing protein 1 [Phytophthora nicotianae]